MIKSEHTTNFPDLLAKAGLSLFATTYQAGKLIIIRSDQGALNTHFRDLPEPMGLFVDQKRLVVGTKTEIIEYRNMPVLSGVLQPPGKHDACYVPRRRYVTGNINIHELVEDEDGIGFVNTKFSAVCSLDQENSFAPVWIPPFISQLVAEDRCHLNGFCFDGGQLKYATALGISDTAKGWSEKKADGGVLIDCQSGEVLVPGLSMPHSPRLYQGRLWLLESGTGSLGFINTSDQFEPIATLPGFTRGLDFFGHLAFIGLSKLRGSATLRGIPLESSCPVPLAGVWVVDIRNGRTVAFVRFDSVVEEIFGVAVLPGVRFPEVLDLADPLIENSFTIDQKYITTVTKDCHRCAMH